MHFVLVLACLVFATVSACTHSADGTGGGASDTGPDGIDGDTMADASVHTWSEIHFAFARGCIRIGCHSSSTGAAAGGLNMSVGIDAHANLLEPARGCEGRRVTPGDPDSSVIVKKLSGKRDGCGARMLFRGQAIPDDILAGIRFWIEEGAPNDMPVMDGVADAEGADGPTFTEVYEKVFKPHCGGAWCHAPWQSPDETRYSVASRENAYFDQVNVRGVCQGLGSPLMRIKPGAPDESLTVRKLEGRGCPSGMPANQLTYAFEKLDQELIDLVRAWVAAGAPDN